MRSAPFLLIVSIFVIGCSNDSAKDDTAVNNSSPTAAASNNQPAQPTSQQQQDASAAEQALRSMGVPIYADAKVDPTQHSSSDPQAVNAVFTTTATTKQVEYFYNSYPELKSQSANGSTVFSGSLNGVPMVIEIRPNKGGTQITAQARKS